MYVWDEITGKTNPVTDAIPVDCPWPKEEEGWEMEAVVDLPDGTRIVIERDGRAHQAVIVTQPATDYSKIETLNDSDLLAVADITLDEISHRDITWER